MTARALAVNCSVRERWRGGCGAVTTAVADCSRGAHQPGEGATGEFDLVMGVKRVKLTPAARVGHVKLVGAGGQLRP